MCTRTIPLSFYGAATGRGPFSRIEALKCLNTAQVPLVGGIIKTSIEMQDLDASLLVLTLDQKKYFQVLGDTKISLVLHGFNPLTFRLFESLSCRSLCIVQSLAEITFADCGLMPEVHYVECKKYLSDLVSKITYYLDHLKEAQSIADAGYLHFKKNFAMRGVSLPDPVYNQMVSTWKGDWQKGNMSPVRAVKRLLLPMVHSL